MGRGTQQIVQYAAAIVGVLVVFGLGYLVLVKPEKAKSTALSAEIQSKSDELMRKSSERLSAERLSKVQVAELLDLTRAMPDSAQMADIIIQLNKLAYESGVRFSSITPAAPVLVGAYQAVPLKVELEGSYYDLMEFLYSLRGLVSVRDVAGAAKLVSSGRLFVIDKLGISLDDGGDPHQPPLKASLDLSAFVYGTQVPGALPVPPTGTATGTSSTTTTTTPAASASSFGGN